MLKFHKKKTVLEFIIRSFKKMYKKKNLFKNKAEQKASEEIYDLLASE